MYKNLSPGYLKNAILFIIKGIDGYILILVVIDNRISMINSLHSPENAYKKMMPNVEKLIK